MELKWIWEFYRPWCNGFFPTAVPPSPTSPARYPPKTTRDKKLLNSDKPKTSAPR